MTTLLPSNIVTITFVIHGWQDYSSSTYWSAATGSYSVEAGGYTPVLIDLTYYLVLNLSGDWATDYRPSKARVYFTGASSIGVVIGDAEANPISGARQSVTSGQEFNLSFDGAGDITQISTNSDSYYIITKIEFYS